MLALYLLSAHLLGDYVLSTRWQAEHKLTDALYRLRHVTAYSVPFVPIAIVYGGNAWWSADFMLALFLLHYLTDSRRFRSTLGDVVAWRWAVTREEGDPFGFRPDTATRDLPLPENPWPPIPLMIDQTLHVVQLALLGGLFLR
jgi:hypothetical protein